MPCFPMLKYRKIREFSSNELLKSDCCALRETNQFSKGSCLCLDRITENKNLTSLLALSFYRSRKVTHVN